MRGRQSAVDRVVQTIHAAPEGGLAEAVVAAATALFTEDVGLCAAMADHGAALIQDGEGILTHCNTGGLATAGIGTALGVVKIDAAPNAIVMNFAPDAPVDATRIVQYVQTFRDTRLAGPDRLRVTLDEADLDRRVARIKSMLKFVMIR